MPALEESVVNFVAGFTGAACEQLHLHTTLFGDLGVDGDDGWDLIQAFGKQFAVNLADFRHDRHFGPECLSLLAPFQFFMQLFTLPFHRRTSPEQSAELVPIRIGDLIDAAKEQRWLLK